MLTLDEMIDKTHEIILAVLNRDVNKALEMMGEYQDKSVYHSLARTILLVAGYVARQDESLTKMTEDAIRQSNTFISSRMRRRPFLSAASSVIFSEDYNDYTDEESLALIASAASDLASTAFLITKCRSLSNYIRGALKIRSCFNKFKECEKIMKAKTNWICDRAKIDFICGTNAALAGFELSISFLPSRFKKLLQFIGHSIDRSAGLERLRSVEKYQESTVYCLVSAGLIIYYGVGVYFYGIGESDYDCLRKIIDHWIFKAPNSFVVNIGTGFKELLYGEFDSAIKHFHLFMEDTRTIKSLRFAGNWLNNWLYSLSWNWKAAAEHSASLYADCKWAPATFAFMHASNLSMIAYEDNNNQELMSQVIELLKETIKREMKFGGQKVFHINFVVEKAKYFIDNPHKIIVVPLHLMYLWNFFAMGKEKEGCLESIKDKIDQEMKTVSDLDTRMLLVFIRGAILAQMNLNSEAMECFNHVLDQ